MAPGHPRRAGSAGEVEHQFGADERVGVRRLVGEDLERERVQRVAGQDRGRLVERLVNGRLAAAQIVIVHRRQVVVDQRIDVDRLQRDGGAAAALAVDTEQVGGGDQQDRPQPLAAADRGVTHRAIQVAAGVVRNDQQSIEASVDIGCHRGHRAGQVEPLHGFSLLQRGESPPPCRRHRVGSPRSVPAPHRAARRTAAAAGRRVRTDRSRPCSGVSPLSSRDTILSNSFNAASNDRLSAGSSMPAVCDRAPVRASATLTGCPHPGTRGSSSPRGRRGCRRCPCSAFWAGRPRCRHHRWRPSRAYPG